jgi:hypothetical protein
VTVDLPVTQPHAASPARTVLAWVPVGVLVCIGILSILSIGIVILPIAGFLSYRLAKRRRSAGLVVPGLLAGASFGPFLIAFINRDGPGYICTRTATSVSCGAQANPWIGVGIGVGMLVVAAVIFLRARRSA